ncbi:ATPase, partial [Salmonella enterica]|nr:ATPase [Salmonella enterica]
MSNKILNPVVLIHKRENSDTYAVAITSGSQDYHDAVLMAAMEPDMTGDNVDTWSKTGYYMAAEIERLRQHLI